MFGSVLAQRPTKCSKFADFKNKHKIFFSFINDFTERLQCATNRNKALIANVNHSPGGQALDRANEGMQSELTLH